MPRRPLLVVVLATVFAGFAGSTAQAASTFTGDLSFGNQGSVTGEIGPADLVATIPSRVLLRDDLGRIVFGAANGAEWQIRRFLPNGTLDPSFGNSGEVVITQWGGVSGSANANLAAGAIRPDGRILLVGYAGSELAGSSRRGIASMVMKQLMPDGSPDDSFGQVGGGLVTGTHSGATSVALRPDGRFVVGGFRQLTATGPADDGVLIGMTADGKRDPTFADGESMVILGAGSKASYVLDLDVLPNGRILAVGANQTRIVVMRLHGNGAYDRSFGRGGRVIVDPGPKGCRCSLGRAMDRDKKGRIIVTGHVTSTKIKGSGYGLTVRLRKNGRIDRSFGKRGFVRLYATPRGDRYVTNLVGTTVDSKGGIWVTGSAGLYSGEKRKAVGVRYLPSGKRDKRFRGGKTTFDLGDITSGWGVFRAPNKMILASGCVVVAGSRSGRNQSA